MPLEGLSHLIKGLESQESWQTQRQFRIVLQHWPKAVGFAVARKTRPTGIQRDMLYVATATAAWAQTLSYERYNILKKLNRYQPRPLKGIRFSTAQWAQPAKPDARIKSHEQHPSYIGHIPAIPTGEEEHLSTDQNTLAQNIPDQNTPSAVFRRWATTMQKMQKTQAFCPQCRCHCPQGELNRWTMCALCAAQRMK